MHFRLQYSENTTQKVSSWISRQAYYLIAVSVLGFSSMFVSSKSSESNFNSYDLIYAWEFEPVGENIEITMNGNSLGSIDPSVSSSPGTLTINVDADGEGLDSILAYFTTTATCGDTLIIKSPEPCPTDLDSSCDLPNGVVTIAIEAEDYTSKAIAASGGDDWTEVADANASGGLAMQVLPNNGTTFGNTPGCCDGGGDDGASMTFDFTIPFSPFHQKGTTRYLFPLNQEVQESMTPII